eukprot:TRINITY_DN5894_c0_g2_i1.p1 TRINITY_DN5894_c0_g2~~TRINITY_DN5894_c0_g2_i1.p1  ORF type:complete len:670 (-),score=163.28 TRINITY_DN5894_c0_g2_i1:1301-3262(-)
MDADSCTAKNLLETKCLTLTVASAKQLLLVKVCGDYTGSEVYKPGVIKDLGNVSFDAASVPLPVLEGGILSLEVKIVDYYLLPERASAEEDFFSNKIAFLGEVSAFTPPRMDHYNPLLFRRGAFYASHFGDRVPLASRAVMQFVHEFLQFHSIKGRAIGIDAYEGSPVSTQKELSPSSSAEKKSKESQMEKEMFEKSKKKGADQPRKAVRFAADDSASPHPSSGRRTADLMKDLEGLALDEKRLLLRSSTSPGLRVNRLPLDQIPPRSESPSTFNAIIEEFIPGHVHVPYVRRRMSQICRGEPSSLRLNRRLVRKRLRVENVLEGFDSMHRMVHKRLGYIPILKSWEVKWGECVGHSGVVTSVCFNSEDQVFLASSCVDGNVCLWNTARDRGMMVRSFQAHSSAARCVKFHPTGALFATCGDDSKVVFWSLNKLEPLSDLACPEPTPQSTLSFNFDGRQMATGGFKKVHVWDVETGKCVRAIDAHDMSVYSVDYHPGLNVLASCGDDKVVRAWDVRCGHCVYDCKHAAWVWHCEFSQDGMLLGSGSQDCTIQIRDWRVNASMFTLIGHHSPVRCVHFSPGGLIFSTGVDHFVRVWSQTTGEPVYDFEGPRGTTYNMDYAPNMRLLATCGTDQKIHLWNMKTKKSRSQMYSIVD